VTSNHLQTVEIETTRNPDAAVIWLHGLGADGHDFEPLVPELHLPAEMALRFVFPHAPHRPVTVNGGMVMRAWYDIISLEREGVEDVFGIREAEKELHALIEREVERGIATERIVLAGFSQGGAVALHTALRYPHRLAGILALSTYLPLADSAEVERHQANASTPIFMAHGQWDEIIALPIAEHARDRLEQMGCPVDWHLYPMGHSLCGDLIRHLSGWLQRVLGAGG
jgi:phospholipase/carboxylesterase